jgi:16S rRNA (guanine(966)-N(2))-methyltransferase RsmD
MNKRNRNSSTKTATPLRVIGGTLKGSKILFSGDPVTRPMKERVREAVFNLLGPTVKSTVALDLFAGTGAMVFEALSRGAHYATAIEKHFPTAHLIRQNAASLGVSDKLTVHSGDAFFWSPQYQPPDDSPWIVFCCPPYALYQSHERELLEAIGNLMHRMPNDSQLVVEADGEFDFATLPDHAHWDVRNYPPAFVGLYRRTA